LNNGKWIASPGEAAGTISLHRESGSTKLSLHRIGMDRAAIVFNQVEELVHESVHVKPNRRKLEIILQGEDTFHDLHVVMHGDNQDAPMTASCFGHLSKLLIILYLVLAH
jgi:hypothetical protein